MELYDSIPVEIFEKKKSMEKFSIRENKVRTYTTRNGVTVEKYPDNQYDVVMGNKVVASIPDYAKNSKGVAEGLAEILNRERKLILPI